MAEATETKEVMRIGATRIIARTPAGAAYVKKVTHPPTTMPNEYCGTPDNSSGNVVIMEVKGEANFPPVYTLPTSTTSVATYNTSSMMFISPSGGRVGTYVFMLNNAPNTQPGWVQAINSISAPVVNQITTVASLNTGYNYANWAQDIGRFRTVYKSETYYLNATNFNNQGTVTTAKFKPNIFVTTLVSALKQHKDCAKSTSSLLQAVAKSKEVDLFDINGVETDYIIQVWELPTNTVGYIRPTTTFLSNYYSIGGGMIPESASGVLNASSKASTRPAREGAFVVHQPIGPVSDWTTTSQTPVTQGPVINGPVISFVRTATGNAYSYAPLWSSANGNSDTGFSAAADVLWNNLDWSYTLFEGLTIPSSVGTTLTSVPYITVKTFAGFEIQPTTNGSLLPFQRSLPPPDRDAIDLVALINHERPDSMPASANDLGTIAGTVLKFLPSAVGWLKDLFGSPAKKEEAMSKAVKFANVKPQKQQQPSKPRQKPAAKPKNKNHNDSKGTPLNAYMQRASSQPRTSRSRSRAPVASSSRSSSTMPNRARSQRR